MPQFKDSTEKGWTVRLTYDGIRAVRDECDGLDLLQVVKPGSDLLDDLAYDDIKLLGVLWALVKGQACDVTRKSFEESMPPACVEKAFVALTESLSDFFGESDRADRVRIAVETIRATQEAETEFRKALGDQMRSFDPVTQAETVAETVANDHETEILSAMLESSTVSSGSSQDVSECTPDGSQLVNSG